MTGIVKWLCGMGLLLVTGQLYAQQQSTKDAKVYAIGAMSDVQAGNLESTTAISIQDDIEFLFGLGPNDSLRGEVTIIHGKIYLSKVNEAGQQEVLKADAIRAPFFVLSEVEHWTASRLQQHVQTLQGLEAYLQLPYHMQREPFAFMIEGKVDYIKYHIQQLPAIRSEDAKIDMHTSRQEFELKDTEVTIIGFYSPGHKGVFTHQDANIHVHFVSADERYSGHIDDLQFGDNDIRLLLPFNPRGN